MTEGSRGRRWASAALVVVATLALAVAVLGTWTEQTLFDSREFAARTTGALDHVPVRHALAEEIADAVIQDADRGLVAYRTPLVLVTEGVLASPAFRSIFRAAVEELHRSVVERHADVAVLELGETLALLAGTAQASGQSFTSQLPREASSLLIDAGPVLERLRLWRLGERLRWLDEAAWVVAVSAAVGAVALDRRRRLALRRLGIGIASAGLIVLAVTVVAPRAASARISDAELARAVAAVAEQVLRDLALVGLWVVAAGAVIAAAATASRVPTRRAVGAVWADARRWAASSRGAGVAGGVALVAAGMAVIALRDALVPLAVVAAGAVCVYAGLVTTFTAVLGRPAASPSAAGAPRRAEHVVMASLGGVLVVAVVASGFVTVQQARDRARRPGELRCNGSAELCDRRLDQVALAGSHNSMSAARDPGWLFAEQLSGIPAQLEGGVRALLVKTHYGIPTGVTVGGAEVVVTDKARESAADAPEEVAELSPEAVARAEQLEQTVPTSAATGEVYLCHVYCTLGATRFSETLADLRHFLDRNPNEVVMLFIGDYVSPEDTAAAVTKAGLLDRVWTYDTTKPPPTLREMIEARRTLLILAEHQGGSPAWYTKGYGIFQDTPFTFADASQFSCAHNRGPADAPLFELNHFLTTKEPPSIDQASQVNAYDVLMGRARQCQQERGMLPNIVAVDFWSVGDLLRVVRDLNGGG